MSRAPTVPRIAPRALDAHKASVGRVLVVGGRLGMSGAPTLSALGALRAGAGLVTIAVPARIQDVVAGALPEALTLGLACDANGAWTGDGVEAALDAARSADAVVVGPGLGRSRDTEAATLRFLAQCPTPVVVDADALHALRGRLHDVASRRTATVLTPHEGEAARLLGVESAAFPPRAAVAERIAREAGAVCVLKGPGTMVRDAKRAWVARTGNPLLATAGSGDVLAGVVAAMLAGLPGTGGDAFGAACVAVHAHGLAGDRLAARRGDRGTLAREIADEIVAALRTLVAPARARERNRSTRPTPLRRTPRKASR